MTKTTKYSRFELALYNGVDKPKIWVAYQGKIYDVTHSRLWQNGRHYQHWAGQDLTPELDEQAPHTANVFAKFKIVGLLN